MLVMIFRIQMRHGSVAATIYRPRSPLNLPEAETRRYQRFRRVLIPNIPSNAGFYVDR
jgi:hypothetical protein